mmetsp:Transcript_16145/g.56318  ORF Transcript_16145/g.56318 Transcript_16145/m.56318 type:complete len:432 (-) Transcript_16145:57-1352(-)
MRAEVVLVRAIVRGRVCDRGGVWVHWVRKRDPFREKEEAENLAKADNAFKRRRTFVDKLHKCMSSAKVQNNIDLYTYFESLYQASDADNLHIGVAEICSLVQKVPCDSHDSCLAHDLVEAFNKMKVVMLVGTVRAHKPITSHVATYRQTYEVVKYSANGLPAVRNLVVYKQRGLLLNFDKHMRLRKRLPLRQLLQIERSALDSRRLGMVFTAKGLTFDEERKCGAGIMETYYELSFKDGGQWREHFIDSILDAISSGPTKGDMEDEGEDSTGAAQDAGGSMAAMARRSAGRDDNPQRRLSRLDSGKELLAAMTQRAAGVFGAAGASFRRKADSLSPSADDERRAAEARADVARTRATLARIEAAATGGIAHQSGSGSAKSLQMQVQALREELRASGAGDDMAAVKSRGLLEQLDAADSQLSALVGATAAVG